MTDAPAPAEKQNIHQAMHAVKTALALHGVAKAGKNKDQNYSFRGVEQIVNALAELFVAHRINVVPKIMHTQSIERTTSNGKPMPSSFVQAQFELVSVDDGSSVVFEACGEGSDMSDKGTNKAMSAAFKYAMTLGFVIPTQGVLDEGDATSPGNEREDSTSTREPERKRSDGSDAADWARKQIATFNAYTDKDADVCGRHKSHPEYRKLMDKLKTTDERLWKQVDTAEQAALVRVDDVPY